MLAEHPQAREFGLPWMRRTATLRAAATERPGAWGFPELFVVSQAVLPALLYLPGTQALRVPIRTSAFVISLVALLFYGKKIFHSRFAAPAQKWLLLCSGYLAFMVFHPTTNSLLAGAAHAMLYFSVLAPMFWAQQILYTPERMQRLLFIILVCSGVNAVVGVLQVYDPGTWMPRDISSVVQTQLYGIDVVSYFTPDGRRIIRPSGLSDSPGAVAGPATVAIVLGLIFCFGRFPLWKRALTLLFALAGFAAVFLSQVRTSLIVACGALIAYTILLTVQKQKRKALVLLLSSVLAVGGAFSLALTLGGPAVAERFGTLFEDPANLYYSARGSQVEDAFTNLLFDYPLGAGLGRWGMMRVYFGDENNLESPPIWAELQPNAWILDGGGVLLLFYSLAVISATWGQSKLTERTRSPALQFSASAIVALNLTTVALIFGYTPFTNQVGLQYWFLTGLLYSMARNYT